LYRLGRKILPPGGLDQKVNQITYILKRVPVLAKKHEHEYPYRQKRTSAAVLVPMRGLIIISVLKFIYIYIYIGVYKNGLKIAKGSISQGTTVQTHFWA